MAIREIITFVQIIATAVRTKAFRTTKAKPAFFCLYLKTDYPGIALRYKPYLIEQSSF
jgi:hypothetical protein